MVNAEQLVIDQSFNDVEEAPPGHQQPEVNVQVGARRPWRHDTRVMMEPAMTSSQVTTWKKPSATTLSSRPASVSDDCAPLIM